MKPATADRVWLTFGHFAVAAMALAAGWLIQSQGQNLPVMDEWYLLTQCLESRSLMEWAFEHHNEHRFPITKLAWAGLLKATNFNLKAPMYASLIALASAAVLMQWTARRIRGHSHPVDALFAVLLLHFGHCFTFLMGYQLGFALFAYGIAGWLWCAAQLTRGGGTIWVILAGVFSALILQCGGFGLAFTPVIAGWFGVVAIQAIRKSKLFGGVVSAGFATAFVAYGIWICLTMPKFVTEEGLDPLDYPFDFIAAIVGYLMSGLGQWPTGLGPVGPLLNQSMGLRLGMLEQANSRRDAAIAVAWERARTVSRPARQDAAARCRGIRRFLRRFSQAPSGRRPSRRRACSSPPGCRP